MSAPMTYHGIASGLSDGGSPRIQVATPSGVLREAPLTRRELVRIIKSAAGALEYLDDQDRRAAKTARDEVTP